MNGTIGEPFVLKNKLNEHPLVPILRAYREASVNPNSPYSKKIYKEFARVNAINMIIAEMELIKEQRSLLGMRDREYVIFILKQIDDGNKRLKREQKKEVKNNNRNKGQ
jgi:hypothetical protein